MCSVYVYVDMKPRDFEHCCTIVTGMGPPTIFRIGMCGDIFVLAT